MRISKNVQKHLDTAELLIEGIRESLAVKPDCWDVVPPQHSAESIKRRCIQARQELLQVEKAVQTRG